MPKTHHFHKKRRFVMVVLFILVTLLVVFKVTRIIYLASIPRKDFVFSSFTLHGTQDMTVVSHYSSAQDGEEHVQFNIAKGKKQFGSVEISSNFDTADQIKRGDWGYVPTVMNGIRGYRILLGKTPEDSSESDIFVFDHNGKGYRILYRTTDEDILSPYVLDSIVNHIELHDFGSPRPSFSPSPSPFSSPVLRPSRGCMSKDSSFCDFTETIKTQLSEGKFNAIAETFILESFVCNSNGFGWTACHGKPDGTKESGYVMMGIGSEGGYETKTELIVWLKKIYLDFHVDRFQASVSEKNEGHIIFFNRDQNEALDFHTKKIDGVWQISFYEFGTYYGPGVFLNSENFKGQI